MAHYVLGHDDTPLSRDAFGSLARSLKTIGEAVRQFGLDDDAIRVALSGLELALDASTASEYVKAFQAGLVLETP